jgi:hypothetical protein
MKVQEVILRAIAWRQAVAIIGISDRSMRRWRQRYEEFGYETGCSTGGEASPPPEANFIVAEMPARR